MRRGDRSQKFYGGFNDKKNLLQNDAMLTRGKNDTESLNHCKRKKNLGLILIKMDKLVQSKSFHVRIL